MKYKHLSQLLLFAGAALIAFPALATTVTLSSGVSGRYFADSAGTVLPDGDLVKIGFFEAGFNFDGVNTIDDLLAGFTTYDNTATTNVFGAEGKILGSYTIDDSAGVFANQAISIIVFNAPDSFAADEAIVITSAEANWVFPVHTGGGTDTTTVSINDEGVYANYGTLAESLLKTTPIGPRVIPRLEIAVTGLDVTLQWENAGGTNWMVQYSGDLISWTDSPDSPVPSGEMMTWGENLGSITRRFYRVRYDAYDYD